MSQSFRYKDAKRLKLCLNCLRCGHMLQNCPSGKCSSKHHTLLHLDQQSSNQIPHSADLLVPNRAVLFSSSSTSPTQTQSSAVLLATASIYRCIVKNRYGTYFPWLLFDLMCVGQIKLADDKPLLQKAPHGWVGWLLVGAQDQILQSLCL